MAPRATRWNCANCQRRENPREPNRPTPTTVRLGKTQTSGIQDLRNDPTTVLTPGQPGRRSGPNGCGKIEHHRCRAVVPARPEPPRCAANRCRT